MVEQLRRLTTSEGFNRFILAMIVLSGVLVGCQTYPAFDETTSIGRVVNLVQNIILWIFVGEIVLKIAACGNRPWEYFKRGWNLFDFTIVLICFLPLDARFATVFRLARLLRTLRMVTILPRLQVLVGALLKSIPSLGYIGILLGLHFYVYACAGTFVFGKNDPIRFGSLHTAMQTLFQVLTLEGWNDVLYTASYGSELQYSDEWKQLAEQKFPGKRLSTPQPAAAAIYFTSFILLGTMIMLNLFTGVIISSMEEAQDEQAEEVREEHMKKKGFLTLHDELNLLSKQLADLSSRIKGMELKEEQREEETADV
ncbi:MAG TPA: ion transporter [Pirellulaceae bacterium]|nr:ion transporter [Pirellulaceae bacterium]